MRSRGRTDATLAERSRTRLVTVAELHVHIENELLRRMFARLTRTDSAGPRVD